MDDRNSETWAARVATLPPPPLAELARRITVREDQYAGFIRRADAWASSRPEPGVVVYPRDAAVVAALGVPCDDCLTLVYAQGEDGHVIRYGVADGEHWAALISAHCGRQPA